MKHIVDGIIKNFGSQLEYSAKNDFPIPVPAIFLEVITNFIQLLVFMQLERD